jgi:ArsR family transcriptional regulator, arsenate/arsenite/antimonite-responsive transcriptional repressor
MPTDRELALMFKALAVQARVRIVQFLKTQALCVGALSARLNITPGAVSQHLRVLKEAGLVEAEKRGYFMHYRLNRQTLSRWQEALKEFLTIPEAWESCLFIKQGGGSMCTCKTECQKPEELQGKPEECSPEQIKKCHGDTQDHPCVKVHKI